MLRSARGMEGQYRISPVFRFLCFVTSLSFSLSYLIVLVEI